MIGVLERFSVPKQKQLWYYTSLVEALKQTAAPKRLVQELEQVVGELKQLTGSTNTRSISRRTESSRRGNSGTDGTYPKF